VCGYGECSFGQGQSVFDSRDPFGDSASAWGFQDEDSNADFRASWGQGGNSALSTQVGTIVVPVPKRYTWRWWQQFEQFGGERFVWRLLCVCEFGSWFAILLSRQTAGAVSTQLDAWMDVRCSHFGASHWTLICVHLTIFMMGRVF